MGRKSPSSVGPPHFEGEGGEAPAQITHLRYATTLM